MRKLLLITAFIATTFSLYAFPRGENELQNKNERSGFDPSRLVYGGQVGFGFGSNDYWAVYLSPQLGYRLTDRITVGAGISYAYAQENFDFYYEYKRKQNQFGLNTYAEFYFLKRFFVSARPEVFYQRQTWRYFDEHGIQQKVAENNYIPAVVLGIGVHFKPVILSLSYDIIQDSLTPYGDTVFLSIGFRF